MKKRNLKSLALNKKTISKMDASEVHGGTFFTWSACAYDAYVIINSIAVAIDVYLDNLDNDVQ